MHYTKYILDTEQIYIHCIYRNTLCIQFSIFLPFDKQANSLTQRARNEQIFADPCNNRWRKLNYVRNFKNFAVTKLYKIESQNPNFLLFSQMCQKCQKNFLVIETHFINHFVTNNIVEVLIWMYSKCCRNHAVNFVHFDCLYLDNTTADNISIYTNFV